MRARRLDTPEEAQAYLTALNRCSAFTEGGRPPLPRCDSGEHGDPRIVQGSACPRCMCDDRADCMPGCPYRTAAASVIYVSEGAGYLVQLAPHVQGQEGEIIDGVDLSPSLAETIGAEERSRIEPVEI